MEPSRKALLVERTYTVELDLPIFSDLCLDMRRFLEAVLGFINFNYGVCEFV